MSIATEITRLQTAKSDLKTSIENKGVTVPASTKLDGYASLVDQISGGGGSSNPVILYFVGTGNSHGTAPAQCTEAQSLIDSEYLQNNNNGTFTILKAGSYTISALIKGGYNTGGSNIYSQVQVKINNTIVVDKTTTSNSPTYDTVTASCNANDTLTVLTRNTNGNSANTHICAVGMQPI